MGYSSNNRRRNGPRHSDGPMTRAEFEKILQGTRITNVILTGFVDRTDYPLQFYALLQTVYFDLGPRLLEVATIGDSGRAGLDVVQKIRHHAELDNEMNPAVSSIRQQVLDDPDGINLIRALNLWDFREASGQMSCSALRIELIGGQCIFVDPSNYFGIRIAGENLQELWSTRSDNGNLDQIDISLYDGFA